jgi:transcription factor SPN1
MTPFNGPIPPSNLLDKIARGVTQAKGEDWPHSLRATRVKLIELARTMAEEDAKRHKMIPEEQDMDCSEYPSYLEGDVLQQTTNIGIGTTGLGIGIGLGPRRPLYRQSSMDFLNSSDLKDTDTINRSVDPHNSFFQRVLT